MTTFSNFFTAFMLAVLLVVTNAAPILLRTDSDKWEVTVNNTINSTTIHNTKLAIASNAPSSPLPITFVNNFTTGSAINAYITGLDGDGAAFFLLDDGTVFYPTNPAQNIPPVTITESLGISLNTNGDSKTVNLPNYITSGRIYFSTSALEFGVNYGANGPVVVAPSFTNPSDPNIDVNYGFAEFTWVENGGIYSNLSFVDFVGLIISQLVKSTSNGVCEVLGLPSNSASTICDELSTQAAQDGQAWDKSCQQDSNGNVLRVLSPLHLTEVDSSALSGYYDDYIDEVWDHYTSNTLTITGGSAGNFTGQVDQSTGEMVFDQGGSFAKPVLSDILGCNSGPFANPAGGTDADTAARLVIVPRFCAAFYRSTLLLPGGNMQPDGVDPSQYYTVSPTMHYSRIVHELELDGKGYAFSYDDVHPDGQEDVSGLCAAPDPTEIVFTVG